MSKIAGTKMSSVGAERTNDVMETRLSGSAFQMLAAATGKARLPTVESVKGGTTRRLVPEEWRDHRPNALST